MAFTFDQVFAADPSNPSNVAQNAAITIFAPGDGTMTPLTITDPDGQPLANPITVNANGFASAFAHATLDRVAWAGGGFTGFFTSYEGMKQVALDAQVAAEAAAATAGTEAAAVADAAVASVIADADSAAEAATTAASSAATAATNAAASATAAANSAALVGAPADEAIAAAVNNSASATRGALDATIATVNAPTTARAANVSRRLGALMDTPPVANRNLWPNRLSNGTNTAQNSMLRHILTSDVTELRLVYTNTQTLAGADSGPGNSITVTSAIELADGTFLPVMFNGVRAVTIASAANVVSDPLTLDLAKGTVIRSRTYVTVTTAGHKWPLGHAGSYVGTLGDGVEVGLSGTVTDKTLGGSLGSASGTNLYGPSAIIGKGATVWDTPSIGIAGDSIAWGQGSEGSARASQAGAGFAQMALNNNFNFVNLADPGDRATLTSPRANHAVRWLFLQGVAHVISNFGVNDLSNGVTLADYQASSISNWKQWVARGAKVWQTTITTVSTSTDGWLTAANQTAGSFGNINPANLWLRDGAPILNGVAVATGSNAVGTLRAGEAGHPLAGVFDVAAPVTTADGKWKDAINLHALTGLTTTAGGTTVTAASAIFSIPTDRYKQIQIPGAGTAGGLYIGQVTAYNSTTSVTVSPATPTAVSGVAGTVYDPMTTDGVHPYFTGAELMATGVDTTDLV